MTLRIGVLGATGATGSQVVRQLLDRNLEVVAIVRTVDRLPSDIREHAKLTVIEGTLVPGTPGVEEALSHCRVMVSCLGHNMSFRGVFGSPRRLVTDSARRTCELLARHGEAPTKFVLMNTVGVRNLELGEKVSVAERIVLQLLRWLIPPHGDNEQAAYYLQEHQPVRPDSPLEWVAVRPDGLIDHDDVTDYELCESPRQSAIFGSGKTSRINVAHFMAELITKDELWHEWKGRMPVIYNAPGTAKDT